MSLAQSAHRERGGGLDLGESGIKLGQVSQRSLSATSIYLIVKNPHAKVRRVQICVHPKLHNINLHNVTHSLISQNPTERMFVV